MTEDEFLAAAKQLMVAKVFAAARRKQAPCVALVDFGLDDIEIGDSVQVTKAWLARPSTKRTRWVEIRGDETALRLMAVWKSTSASGAPDNSSLGHFSAMTRPSWLGRAVKNRHRHAVEQVS